MTDSQTRIKKLARHANPEVAKAIDGLLGLLENGTRNRDLIHEILTNVMRLSELGLDRGEMKIVSRTIQDLEKAFPAFDAHSDRKRISIFGSARSPAGSEIYEHCKRFGAASVERGYMVITGAGPGIMQAGNEGAGRENSFGVSIMLPFEARANPVIDGDPKLVEFRYFFTRKLSFVKESDAIVLYPGGFGTLDEGFEALTLLQTGKCDPLPMVLMDAPGGDYWPAWEKYVRENLLARNLISSYDRNLYRFTSSIDDALDEIDQFYRCYHSLRYVGDYTILRLKSAPSARLLEILNERYRDLLADGDFEVMKQPHSAEKNEPDEVQRLHRIGFRFVQRKFARLRRLIDEINLAADAPLKPMGKGHRRATASLRRPEDLEED